MTTTHYRFLAVCWTLAILAAYSLPNADVSIDSTVQLDKVAHCAMFLGFGFLWMHAVHPPHRHSGRVVASLRRTSLLLASGAGLSILAELYQELLPRRAAELSDAAANILGLLVAIAFFWWRHPPRSDGT